MFLLKSSFISSFIFNSSSDILNSLNIKYEGELKKDLHSFLLSVYDPKKSASLYEDLMLKDILIADSILYEELRKLNPKALLFSDFILKQNFSPKKDFKDFAAAFYSFDKDINLSEKFALKQIKIESNNKDNGYRFLNINEDLAYKMASTIVLDAYDNGADFLIVEDAYSFHMFDGLSAQLLSFSRRDFRDFYILSFSEFLALSLGLIPESLKKHKLKVSLL